ncbi:hypothetical protein D6C80_01516 [Aureobasidium pullulans]|nr:hypothetical protein D6C80_01516 [Aureobasidium pullulans]
MTRPYHPKPVLADYNEDTDQALRDDTFPGRLSLLTAPETRCPDSPGQRPTTEHRYVTLVNRVIRSQWPRAELAAYEVDKMMSNYLYQYPMRKWVIDPKHAELAYDTFLARESLRRQGRSIYDENQPHSPWSREISASAIQHARITSAPPPPGTDALDTAASSRPDPLEPTGEYPYADLDTEVVSPRFKKEDSILKAPPQDEDSNYEKPFTADGLSQNVDGSEPQHMLNQTVSTSSGERSETRESSSEAGFGNDNRSATIDEIPPYMGNPKPKCLLEALARTKIRQERSIDEFPWRQTWANNAPTHWDDTIYPGERLKELKSVHEQNEFLALEYGAFDSTNYRKKKQPSHLKTGHHSLQFRDQGFRYKYKDLIDFESARKAIKAILSHHPNMSQEALERLSEIEIYYGSKHSETGLKPFYFSLLDSVRTRIQISSSEIFSLVEARRIIDFAPDLLTGITLLRVLAVGDGILDNFDLRHRLMLNGNYVNLENLRKRLENALGIEMHHYINKKDMKSVAEVKKWSDVNHRHFQEFQEF